MELLDIVLFALFRCCEVAGAAIFALRFRDTAPGILGVAGFLGLFLTSIGQRIAIVMFEVSQDFWWIGVILEVFSFCLILAALWRMPAPAGGPSAESS